MPFARSPPHSFSLLYTSRSSLPQCRRPFLTFSSMLRLGVTSELLRDVRAIDARNQGEQSTPQRRSAHDVKALGLETHEGSRRHTSDHAVDGVLRAAQALGQAVGRREGERDGREDGGVAADHDGGLGELGGAGDVETLGVRDRRFGPRAGDRAVQGADAQTSNLCVKGQGKVGG